MRGPAPPSSRPPRSAGVAVAVLGVAATTLLVYPLREVAPVLSLGVVYHRPLGATALLRRNLLIGGLIAPFIGIKLIDLSVHNLLGG